MWDWLGGSDGRDRSGSGSVWERGSRGQGPSPHGAVTREREPWLISPIRACHTPSPLNPTAPAHCPAKGRGWKWALPDFIHFCRQLTSKALPPLPHLHSRSSQEGKQNSKSLHLALALFLGLCMYSPIWALQLLEGRRYFYLCPLYR